MKSNRGSASGRRYGLCPTRDDPRASSTLTQNRRSLPKKASNQTCEHNSLRAQHFWLAKDLDPVNSTSVSVLVTGGAGYIGSHTSLLLLEAGYSVAVVDNLSNASRESLRRVEQLTQKPLRFYEADLLDAAALDAVFRQESNIEAVIHFAALKAVGESVQEPLRYYHNNLTGSLHLFETMARYDVRKVVFSSSATVYGEPTEAVPVTETAPLGPTNPYGHTKSMMEQILLDLAAARPWGVALLRYFNPVGAHPSGEIGEDPEYPNNLMPFVMQVAAGLREKVVVFGEDYPTPDGTGVRDYIHVMDLGRAHVAALRFLDRETPGRHIFNLGTGRGYSVKEVIEAARSICNRPIPSEVGARRAGDISSLTANPEKAERALGWKAEHGLEDMLRSAWTWQSKYPRGYRG